MSFYPEGIPNGVPTIVTLENSNNVTEWNIVTEQDLDEKVLLNLSKKLSVNDVTVCCFKASDRALRCRYEFSSALCHEIYWDTSLRNLLVTEKEIGNLVSVEDRPRKYWKLGFLATEHERGFNIDKTALMIAIESQNTEKIAKLIGKSSLEEINTETLFGNTALLYSIHSGNFETVHKLLRDMGFNVDKTTLMDAVESQITKKVAKLIKKSSLEEINAKTPFGNTALHYAIKSQNIELVKMLIKAGANINVFGEIIPLQYASSNPKILKQLISYNPEIDFLNRYDETALMFAASSGNSETVSLLLEYGADKELKNAFGEDASDKARSNKHYEIVALLS